MISKATASQVMTMNGLTSVHCLPAMPTVPETAQMNCKPSLAHTNCSNHNTLQNFNTIVGSYFSQSLRRATTL